MKSRSLSALNEMPEASGFIRHTPLQFSGRSIRILPQLSTDHVVFGDRKAALTAELDQSFNRNRLGKALGEFLLFLPLLKQSVEILKRHERQRAGFETIPSDHC